MDTVKNVIAITGGAYVNVKKAIKQWLNLYQKQLDPNMSFELFKAGRGNHILKADDKLDNELFFFLVNYLKYPENLSLKAQVHGFTIGDQTTNLTGKELLAFVDDNDTEGDNVTIVTRENKSYLFDFGGKLKVIESSLNFYYPSNFQFENPDRIQLKTTQRKKGNDIKEIHKRFSICSVIVIAYLLLNLFLDFDKIFNTSINFLFSYVLFMWFFLDYEMLRIRKLYFASVLISLINTVYFQFIIEHFNQNGEPDTGLLGISFSPLLLLLVQKPLRLLFIWITKREPIIERPAPTVPDFIYVATLFFTPVISLNLFT